MANSQALLTKSAQALLFSMEGHRIGSVGSPSEDFRDTWRAKGSENIHLEVGGTEVVFRTFSVNQHDLNAIQRSLDVSPAPSTKYSRQSFPRYTWFRDEVVEDILIVRDEIQLIEDHGSLEYTYDIGVVFLTKMRALSFFMIREDWGGVAMGHEPRPKGSLRIHTQPSPYHTNRYIHQSEQRRRLLPLHEAWIAV